MFYQPQKNPNKAMIMVSIITLVGFFAGYAVSPYFTIGALFFIIQFTAVRSYMQFKSGHKHSYNSVAEILLHPQVRFFLFEFIAIIGIWAWFVYQTLIIGVISLFAWWLFSLNFYLYYKKKEAAKDEKDRWKYL
jgi:hypothetical protein